MSEQSIWSALRAGGLTSAGAAGMMGNMFCESALKSNNVQDGMGWSDEAYTEGVDSGSISRTSFKNDARGYGLCQWTYYTRKDELYGLAKTNGVSISDETMQVQFCLKELKRDNANLYAYLCVTNDIYIATTRICSEYERPAVNNFNARFSAANDFYDRLSGVSIDTLPVEDLQTEYYVPKTETTESTEITVRTVRMGDTGTDVAMLQAGLNKMGYGCGSADGIFGSKTQTALNSMKQDCNLMDDGIADGDTWQILFQ